MDTNFCYNVKRVTTDPESMTYGAFIKNLFKDANIVTAKMTKSDGSIVDGYLMEAAQAESVGACLAKDYVGLIVQQCNAETSKYIGIILVFDLLLLIFLVYLIKNRFFM